MASAVALLKRFGVKIFAPPTVRPMDFTTAMQEINGKLDDQTEILGDVRDRMLRQEERHEALRDRVARLER